MIFIHVGQCYLELSKIFHRSNDLSDLSPQLKGKTFSNIIITIVLILNFNLHGYTQAEPVRNFITEL